MSVYGKINVNDFTIVESKFHKTKHLDENTSGVSRVLALSSSKDVTDEFNKLNAPTTGSSHWYFGRVMYYSASFGKGQAIDKALSLFEESPKKIPHKHKYFNTASFFYIPQKYFGEEIKKKSFKLTDGSHPSGSVEIRDDGEGNLYAINANVSKSNSSVSSSDNYVGNIFYNSGMLSITDTGSYLHTTPSTATITVGGGDVPFLKDNVSSFFFVSGSDLETPIKFLCTSDGSGTDTSTLKHFSSASATTGDKGKTEIALNAVNKVNQVFGGNHITASSVANVITLSNESNKLFDRRPRNVGDDLPPISGSSGFTTASGFTGGTAPIFYQNIGTNTGSSGAFDIKFDSTQTFFIRQWNVKLKPNRWMSTMNISARGLLSGSSTSMATIHKDSPMMKPELTGSGWSPYVSQIALYNDTEIQKVKGDNGEDQLKFAEPLVIANLPRPIKMRDDMTIIFKIKLDY